MGESVRIRDMAEQMIRFYGFEPEEDIKIEYVGLRPGERLDEQLWGEDEIPRETPYSRILRVDRRSPPVTDIRSLSEKLKPICCFDPQKPRMYRNTELLRELLAESIPSLFAAVYSVGQP
jgi:FlaA1/EpsC-like NDP-sugar epimerase